MDPLNAVKVEIDCWSICRTCLTSNAVTSLSDYSDENEESTLGDMLEKITGVCMEEGLSNVICSICAGDLRSAIAFRRRAQLADKTLRQNTSDAHDAFADEIFVKTELNPLLHDLVGTSTKNSDVSFAINETVPIYFEKHDQRDLTNTDTEDWFTYTEIDNLSTIDLSSIDMCKHHPLTDQGISERKVAPLRAQVTTSNKEISAQSNHVLNETDASYEVGIDKKSELERSRRRTYRNRPESVKDTDMLNPYNCFGSYSPPSSPRIGPSFTDGLHGPVPKQQTKAEGVQKGELNKENQQKKLSNKAASKIEAQTTVKDGEHEMKLKPAKVETTLKADELNNLPLHLLNKIQRIKAVQQILPDDKKKGMSVVPKIKQNIEQVETLETIDDTSAKKRLLSIENEKLNKEVELIEQKRVLNYELENTSNTAKEEAGSINLTEICEMILPTENAHMERRRDPSSTICPHPSILSSEHILSFTPNKPTYKKYFVCIICKEKCKTKKEAIIHMKMHKELTQQKKVVNIEFKNRSNTEKEQAGSIKLTEICERVTSNENVSTSDTETDRDPSSTVCPDPSIMYSELVYRKYFVCVICKEKCKTKMEATIHMKMHKELKTVQNTKKALDEMWEGTVILESKKKEVKRKENHPKIIIETKKLEKKIEKVEKKREKVEKKREKVEKKREKREKHFLCPQCGLLCQSDHSLVIHQRRMHTGEKPYKCSICDKSWTCMRELRSHHVTHFPDRERPFKCSECGKGFHSKYNLRVHMQSHSDKCEFQCIECDRRFGLKSNLIAHRKRVHGLSKSTIL